MKKANQFVYKLKENRGITLIALVITIIVLLILAGVAVSSITGNDDIMDKAQNAKVATDNANEEEEIKMAAVTAMADNMEGLGVLTTEKLSKALNNKYTVVDEGDKIKVFAINQYTLDKNGNVKNDGETPKGEFSITSFSYTPNTVSIGGTSSEPAVAVAGTPYQGPRFTSSDESKATVNETTGVVTGVASGDVTITVTYKNYQNIDVTRTCSISVYEKVTITSFNYTSSSINVGTTSSAPNKTITGTAKTGPTYSITSGGSYATINSSTGAVTGTAAGSVTVQISYTNYDDTIVTKSTTVTITIPPITYTNFGSVTASGTEPSTLVQSVAIKFAPTSGNLVWNGLTCTCGTSSNFHVCITCRSNISGGSNCYQAHGAQNKNTTWTGTSNSVGGTSGGDDTFLTSGKYLMTNGYCGATSFSVRGTINTSLGSFSFAAAGTSSALTYFRWY